jgi:hypothetical protein
MCHTHTHTHTQRKRLSRPQRKRITGGRGKEREAKGESGDWVPSWAQNCKRRRKKMEGQKATEKEK